MILNHYAHNSIKNENSNSEFQIIQLNILQKLTQKKKESESADQQQLPNIQKITGSNSKINLKYTSYDSPKNIANIKV